MFFLTSDWINILGILLNLSALFYVSSRIQTNINNRRVFKDYIIKEITEIKDQYNKLFNSIERNELSPVLIQSTFMYIISSHNALSSVIKDHNNHQTKLLLKLKPLFSAKIFNQSLTKTSLPHERNSIRVNTLDSMMAHTIKLQTIIEDEQTFQINFKSQRKFKSSDNIKAIINDYRTDFAVLFHQLCININYQK